MINSINIATEISDSNLPFTRTSIYTFIKNNSWFNGTIFLLTHPDLPVSQSTITSIRSIYDNINILSVTQFDQISKFFEANKKLLNQNSTLSILKYSIFFKGLDRPLLYFNSKSLFVKDVSSELAKLDHLVDQKLNYIYLDPTSNITLDFIRDYKYSNESTLVQDIFQRLETPNYFGESFYVESSAYPDFKFKQLSASLANATAILFSSINHSNLFKINQIWLQKNKESTASANRPINKNNLGKSAIINKSKVQNYPTVTENVDLNSINFNSITVIIPAYNVHNYIEECLDSIVSQDPNIKILVGIDNCKPTLDALEKIKNKYLNLKVFFSNNSAGPYVIRNSLAQFVDTDNILFFDADDIMSPKLISTLLSNNNGNRPIRFKYINFQDRTHHLSSKNFNLSVAHGVFFIPVSVFKKIGGFQPWICGADTEFIKRCESNRINSLNLGNYLFYRRIHSNSLTQNKKTNFQSQERIRISKWIKSNKDWKIPIKPITISLIEK